ncbi:PLDc N-terminal domain-containing protein [Halobacillus halophilus]|uniref:PLDc N-terminal domain-containing protein n=1 Tax=Halobacillus halophilus TaxID=1570 RepID=UPI001CD412F8|nr:PLDc N-terminal domain-containing protein [Halobacillus halophilus]MCA1012602.1 PLDc N-terminal domain-containing protein [Halobacillus halophilus]
MMEFNFALLFAFLLFGLLLLILNIVTSIWSYRDSRRKGRSPEFAIMVLLGTLFFPVIGLVIYLVIRNDI